MWFIIQYLLQLHHMLLIVLTSIEQFVSKQINDQAVVQRNATIFANSQITQMRNLFHHLAAAPVSPLWIGRDIRQLIIMDRIDTNINQSFDSLVQLLQIINEFAHNNLNELCNTLFNVNYVNSMDLINFFNDRQIQNNRPKHC